MILPPFHFVSLFSALLGSDEIPQNPEPNSSTDCRCVPGDSCWPQDGTWENFNLTLGGNLIKSEPIALPCYDGQFQNSEKCAYVSTMWPKEVFQTDQPLGRVHPYNMTCPPVDHAIRRGPEACTLGQLPTYVVKVTERQHVKSALEFATKNNIRVTVTTTGHDVNGRGDGYGSLGIWLRYFRNPITFQEKFVSDTGCTTSGWSGSAIHIDGAWQWGDVHKVAEENNVIVISGGSSSPGAIGGWLSGGGHGPATRNYGLGADQLLEAEVMLADGNIATVNHCEMPDLFRALRGGGPGFGIVLSAKIKAYPNVDIVARHKAYIVPTEQTGNSSDLLDAVSVLLQSFPDLNKAGFAGYGIWFRNSKTVFLNATSAYIHSTWTIGKGKEEADAAYAPIRKALSSKFKDKLTIIEDFKEYRDYWSFYKAELDQSDNLGGTIFLTSRMINQEAVKDYDHVREAVEVLSGGPEQHPFNIAMMVSGGQVSEDAADTSSGLNPAWRKSSFVIVTGLAVPKTASVAERQAVQEDITFVKGAALKTLAPDTGAYMNEGDRNDPEYIKTFYGANYDSHLAAKKKYDPSHVFYCPTCVGSEAFVDRPNGALCRA